MPNTARPQSKYRDRSETHVTTEGREKGKALGRKTLRELTTIVTPDTILRWHRELVAQKWDYSHKRKSVGRPRIRQIIVDLIPRFAAENKTWGYDRIQGALANVGYCVSDTTVKNVLKAHGPKGDIPDLNRRPPEPQSGALTN